MRCIVANLVDGGGNELAEVSNLALYMYVLCIYNHIHISN